MIDVTCIMCLAVNNLIQQAKRRAETETAAFIYEWFAIMINPRFTKKTIFEMKLTLNN